MTARRSTALFTVGLLALCALPARGQQGQAATAAAAAAVPAMDCPVPGFAPLDKSGTEMTRFQKRVDEYKVCVNKYAAANGAKANELADQSRAHADAANKAIDDYNAYVTKLNESSKSTK